jgi:hypothetical protein
VTTFSIGIRTIARRVDYCRGTLLRLVESGTLQHPSLRGLHLHHGEGITPNQNGARAIQLAAHDDVEWVIFLEDDVDMIDDFLGSVDRWLARYARPEVRAYPLSCFYSDAIAHFREAGVWEMPIEKFYGSQGFVMPVLDAIAFSGWVERQPRAASFDLYLSEWHRLVEPEQPHLLTPAPCFLDHTGEFSSLGPPGSWERVGRVEGFAGRDWSFA